MRSSGILCHFTSLPGDVIGTLGGDARHFVDVLAAMGQRWWQVLPVGPTGYQNSPYQPTSTFAGNPALISFEDLARAGLIDHDGVNHQEGKVDYDFVAAHKDPVLATLAQTFSKRASRELIEDRDRFVEQEEWLNDYALFEALRRVHGKQPWWDWPEPLKRREPDAIAMAEASLAHEIEAVRIEQFLFDTQLRRLREACKNRGVGLIGDLPIFVAMDSVDVWANPELFKLDDELRPTVVAGVPPDYFSATGQRWGNPIYRWESHRRDGFSWWRRRFAAAFERFDMVRIDHFRGFVAAWEIPADRSTAVEGQWVKGPGEELFEALGDARVIAEDLGVITPAVDRLRDRYGFPGMKVLAFGFGADSAHSIDRFEPNSVAYTGTHDNDTAMGWWADPERDDEHLRAREVLDIAGNEFNWALIEALMRSKAETTIVPLQDLIGLGSDARMNTPGTASGNWEWRFSWTQITEQIIERMRTLTTATGRQEVAGE